MPAPTRSIRSRPASRPAEIGSILPGLYDFPHYRCRTCLGRDQQAADPAVTAASPAPASASRSRSRSMRRRATWASSPRSCAGRSLVRPGQMPFDNIAKRHFDSGDYPAGLTETRRRGDRARRGARAARAAASPTAATPRRRARDVFEQAGHGTSVYASWGIPFVPGYEPCLARFTAGWRVSSCASARIATVRAWRRRCPRSRIRSSACRTSASS